MSSESDPTWLTVDEAARLAGVSSGTVRNWIKSGALPAETTNGSTRIDSKVFVEAKLLRETELLNLQAVKQADVSAADVTTARLGGVVVPTAAPDRRFSIRDGLALAAWKQGGALPEETPQAAPCEEAPSRDARPIVPPVDRSGRVEALFEYMTMHADPAKIPVVFWDTRVCPDFVPPVGVFRAWYAGSGAVEDESGPIRFCTAIARSATWVVRDGSLEGLPTDDTWQMVEGCGREPGSEPPEYAAVNLRYRELARAWHEAWRGRRRELLASGVRIEALPDALAFEGRDRVAAIDRYHREYQSPADLPDWFYATEECPPFVPPTGVFRWEFGETYIDPRSGETRTWVRTSPGWSQQVGEASVTFVPGQDRHHSVAGVHPRGATPSEHAEANLRYELAAQEWVEEWRQRRDFLRTQRSA